MVENKGVFFNKNIHFKKKLSYCCYCLKYFATRFLQKGEGRFGMKLSIISWVVSCKRQETDSVEEFLEPTGCLKSQRASGEKYWSCQTYVMPNVWDLHVWGTVSLYKCTSSVRSCVWAIQHMKASHSLHFFVFKQLICQDNIQPTDLPQVIPIVTPTCSFLLVKWDAITEWRFGYFLFWMGYSRQI